MARRVNTSPGGPGERSLGDVIAELKRKGTRKQVDELGRYGIVAHEPFGVTMADLKGIAKSIGTDRGLAQELWDTGRYEARLLAAFVDDPDKVTAKQMDAWARDFDNWAIVDTVCFHLFDRTRHAWKAVPRWAKARMECKKRAAFALLWGLTVHDKESGSAPFIDGLALIEPAATDERVYVKKAVNMALRAIGKRSLELNRAAIETATRLAASDDATARWVGSHALRELRGKAVQGRLERGG